MIGNLAAHDSDDGRKAPLRGKSGRRIDHQEHDDVLHVLLVEDNPAEADLCIEYLEAGFVGQIEVAHVTRLEQARRVLQKDRHHHINAVLLDLQLPDATGLEGLVSLRQLAPTLPIIVLTGSASMDLGVVAIREHAEDYCTKDELTVATLRRMLRHALERNRWRNRYRNLLEISPDGIVVLDDDGTVLFANASAFALTGDSLALRVGEPFPYAIPDDPRGSEIPLPDRRVADMRIVPVDWEGRQQRLMTLRDITARKNTEKQLLDLVRVDQLTGLASRTHFLEFLARMFSTMSRHNKAFALLFIDLDRFKSVNDSLGHRVGDGLLQNVGQRLATCLRQDDFLGRLGGDEFGLVLPDIKRPEEAAYVARKVLDTLAAPFSVDGRELTVGASIGIALYPSCGDSMEEMLRAADAAMYRAKDHGRNTYHFYSPDIQASAMTRLKMEAALRRSLEMREFVLYFQPQISVAGMRVVSMEALLRWTDPDYGHLGCEQVISVAEDIGLITPLGDWVLRQALANAATWQNALRQPTRVSVNVSAHQLRQQNFVGSVLTALSASGLKPGALELEVTEGVLIGDSGQAIQALTTLRKSGINIVIDDFGTGYSSLSYLLRLPITGLKLDKGFIKNVGRSTQSEAIIESLIRLAHALGLSVTAEGVENEIQQTFLRQCDCDFVQGFYFSEPVSAGEVVSRLRSWSESPHTESKR